MAFSVKIEAQLSLKIPGVTLNFLFRYQQPSLLRSAFPTVISRAKNTFALVARHWL